MKQQFYEQAYSKIKEAILDIDTNEINDIYALSFWFFNEDDELHFPTIMLSYNTISNYKINIENASDEQESKWNFAYWLQDDILQVGGEEDLFLSKWFKSSEYYYCEEEMENADDELFDKLCSKGQKFCNEFIELMIDIVKKLNEEKVIFNKFGKSLPVLIHELEYSEETVDWCNKANSQEVIKEFENWVKTM